jgi:hypothetical protein
VSIDDCEMHMIASGTIPPGNGTGTQAAVSEGHLTEGFKDLAGIFFTRADRGSKQR